MIKRRTGEKPGLQIGVRRALSGVVLFLVTQTGGAIAHIARLSVVVAGVGVTGLGYVVLLGNIGISLGILGIGFADLGRTWSAEAEGEGSRSRALVAFGEARSVAVRWVIGIAGIGLFVVVGIGVLGVEIPYVSGSSELDLAWLVAILLLVGASALYCAPAMGYLDALGDVHISNPLRGSVGMIGLCLTGIVMLVGPSIASFSVAWSCSLAAPYWIAMAMIAIREKRAMWRLRTRPTSRVSVGSSWELVLAPMVGALSTVSAPVIVGLTLGPESVAGFAVANRLGYVVLLLPFAVRPIVWTRVSRLRGAGHQKRLRIEVPRWVSGMILLGGSVGVGFVMVGPSLAEIIAGGPIVAPIELYVGLAVSGAMAAGTVPFLAVASGPFARRLAIVVSGGVTVMSMALQYVLVHDFGVSGAAWAMALAGGGGLICWVVLFRRGLIDLSMGNDSSGQELEGREETSASVRNSP